MQPRPTDYSDIEQFDSLITVATSAFRKAVAEDDTVSLIYAASSLAQAYLFSSDLDSVGWYLKEVEPYIPYSDQRINTYFYNTSGIYSLITDLNYANALEYYLNGYDGIKYGPQYFDKIALVAFDSSHDITAQFRECRSSAEPPSKVRLQSVSVSEAMLAS